MNNGRDADMLEEYDFSGGVRGKYAARFHFFALLISRRLDQDRQLLRQPWTRGIARNELILLRGCDP